MTWYKTTPVQRTPKYNVASGTIAHFSDGAEDVPMKSVVANIVPIQEGTGIPSPSNPRPISGTSVLNVTRTGKNLNGFTLADFQGGIIVGNARFIGIKIPKSTITYSSNAPTGNVWVARDFTDITTANNRVFSGSPVTYDNVEWLCIGLQKDNMETAFEYLTQAEYGNVATTYEPYNAETYTFDLGQTIYGGTADVVGGTGEETHAKVNSKSLTFKHYEVSQGHLFRSSVISDMVNQPNQADILCSDYETKYPTSRTDNSISNTLARQVDIIDNRFTTAADFMENTDFDVVYPLQTPTEYTFTGQPINSYLGVNNVWTDSGEVLDVEYPYMPVGSSGAYFPAGSV